MKKIIFIALMTLAFTTGCKDGTTTPTDVSNTARTSTVTYVCVGMEKSKRFGECPGCKYDSERMDKLFRDTFGYKGSLFQSEKATRDVVVRAIKDAVKATTEDSLFIFYYSGHGGQEYLGSPNTSEPSGADEEDEYLCLYDTYLLDDEVWNMISKCKGRVFLIFDCCHSQTMFRSVATEVSIARGLGVPLENKMVKSRGFNFKPRAIPLETDSLRMLCWSGCLEKEYSYGSSRGGVMTNSMLARWSNGMSYDNLWKYIETDVNKAQPTQHPKATQYGTGFKEAFK